MRVKLLTSHPPTFPELALCTASAAFLAGVSGYSFAAGHRVAGWLFAVTSAGLASMWVLRAAHEMSYLRHRRGVIAAAEEAKAHGKR
jgi:multisubunit Na+/H+ antiporter MnhG subunit